jgi:metal-responsive CopG/Arc/MetJ family transcriptional regulator
MAQRKTAEHATRFTVSLPGALMQTLDRLRSGRAYSKEQTGETVGVLVLVDDHDTRALADKLTDIQHEHHGAITAALHVHLDAHTCLEVIPLRGAARRIRQIANRLLSNQGRALRPARARHGPPPPMSGEARSTA